MSFLPKRSPKPPSYRHWLELPVLAVTLLVLLMVPYVLLLALGNLRLEYTSEDPSEIGIALAVLLSFLLLVALLGVVGGITLTLWSARRKLGRLRRGAVCVGPEQFPAIHALAESARTALGITTPVTVYLLDTSKLPNPTPPIAVLGVTKPYVIMLSVTLLEQMEVGELQFLLGVEYGHVKLGHVRILTLIDAVNGSLGRVPFLGGFIRVLFLAWTRLATFSADRAGLVACRRLAAAYSVMGKFTVGPKYWGQVNHVALARQASRTRGRFFDAANRTTVPFDTQPLGRFQRLVAFAASPNFQLLCPDADLNLPHLELWR